MDLWVDTAANTTTRSAYKAGYASGSRVAASVDVMRWDALFHCAEFRDSPAGRSMAHELKTAKQKADAARNIGILIAFATAVTLLVAGAAAAWAATLGGKHRDELTDTSAFWRWS